MSDESQSIWSQKMSFKEQMTITRRIFKFTKPYLSRFIIAFIFSMTAIGASVTLPRIVQTYIDDHLALNNLNFNTALAFIGMYFGVLSVQIISNYLSTYLFGMASERTVESVRNTMFTKINGLGMRFFDQTPAGSIISRVSNDTETLKNFWNVFFSLTEGIITLVTVFIGMYLLNRQAALLFLPFVPVMMFFIWFYQKYSSQIYRQMRENLSVLNTKINESVLGMNIIQNFRQEKRTIEEFEVLNETAYRNHLRVTRMNSTLLMPAIRLLEDLSVAVVIWFLGRQFLDGMLEIGIVYAFVQYSSQFFRPMGMMMDNLSLLQDGTVSSARILRYLDNTEYVPEQNNLESAQITEAHVKFENLTFSYDNQTTVLNDISFEVKPGETVAIVGHTGSGKSSLINVLMRFYEFQGGDVTIDGHSIRDFTYETMRSNIGLVLQESFLFYGDIARNIRLLDQSITDYEVQSAAQFVHADRFINNFSDGYRHRVIERGGSFSGGEKQLISFARTMARNPKLLILDEATANIDTETESLIQDSLSRMQRGRTTIAIAHRLSTIKDADQIIVLDKGRIIEQGTHDELIEKQGNYYQMYSLQTMN